MGIHHFGSEAPATDEDEVLRRVLEQSLAETDISINRTVDDNKGSNNRDAADTATNADDSNTSIDVDAESDAGAEGPVDVDLLSAGDPIVHIDSVGDAVGAEGGGPGNGTGGNDSEDEAEEAEIRAAEVEDPGLEAWVAGATVAEEGVDARAAGREFIPHGVEPQLAVPDGELGGFCFCF
jgi:hypothetical protein